MYDGPPPDTDATFMHAPGKLITLNDLISYIELLVKVINMVK